MPNQSWRPTQKGLLRKPLSGPNKRYSTLNNNIIQSDISQNPRINYLIEYCYKAYNDLPANSLLKNLNSSVSKRIKLTIPEIINSYIKQKKTNAFDINQLFQKTDDLNVPGIYCFKSKSEITKIVYYLGSSVNMHRRITRHKYNVFSPNPREYSGSPKFYNWIRSYGWNSLEIGYLLKTIDYEKITILPGLLSSNALNKEERLILKLLTQIDLLIMEQYFLDKLGLSLNVDKFVGTRHSSILSLETRNKMSESHFGDSHYSKVKSLTKEQWELIRNKASQSWQEDYDDSHPPPRLPPPPRGGGLGGGGGWEREEKILAWNMVHQWWY